MADPTVPSIDSAIRRSGELDLDKVLTRDEGKVNSFTLEYIELERQRVVCRRVWGGTQAMRDAGEDVLERWEGEDPALEYEPRRKRAVLTNFFKNAVETNVDDAYSEPLSLTPDESLSEEDAATIAEWWKNVDRKGRTGTHCARDTSESSLGFGRPGLLVDFPRLEERAETRADEPRRWPILKEIPAENVIEAAWIETDGDVRLSSVRYYDPVSEKLKFGAARIERFTVLRRGGDGETEFSRMEIYNADPESGEYPEEPSDVVEFSPPENLVAERRAAFVEIPFVFKETGKGPTPKMLGLAELNTQHYRITSHFDEATIASMVPFDIFIGFDDKDMQLFQRGTNRYLSTPKSPQEATRLDGTFSFASSQTGAERLNRLEEQMAVIAKQPKSTKASGAEVATIRMRDDKAKLSRLQSWFLQWLAADQQVVDWASLWLGLPASAVLGYKAEVFDSLVLDPSFAELLDLFDRVVEYPEPVQEVAFKEAKRYGILDESIEIEGEDGLLAKLRTAPPVE